jgi:chorismate synthase
MSGNTFGTLFAVTNFGESHGPAIGCVIDGCPPGMELSETDIQPDLDRRRPGTSRFVTQRQEADRVEILSGVYEGRTTGTPIGLLIRNTDQRSKDYRDIEQVFRPGHADYTYLQKFGLRDPRGGGRASARLTAPLVAAGAVAKKWLGLQYGTVFRACMQQIGDVPIPFESWEHVPNNPFFAPIADVSHLESYLDGLRKAGDSCGARVRAMASVIPVGLGEPLFDKLDADIAYAMMGINAVKGVEIGAGFASVTQRGSTHGDSATPQGFRTNHAGGVLGGISTGQDLEVSIAIKPTSSILSPRESIDVEGRPTQVVTKGRHDPCVGIRAVPIAEAMLALVVMEHVLRQRAQNADVRPALAPIAASVGAPPAQPVMSQRIDLIRESDVAYWCRIFGVSIAQLRQAVQHAGPRVEEVRRYLDSKTAP